MLHINKEYTGFTSYDSQCFAVCKKKIIVSALLLVYNNLQNVSDPFEYN